MKLVKKVRVKNRLGIHTRPAAAIVKLLQPRKSSVFFKVKTDTINARSIMSILMLAAKKNSVIEVEVEGDDAELTMQQLIDAFEREFGDR